MKKMIFFLPYKLDEKAARARMVRPRKMMQAFRDNGFEVFEISGYARERKKKISEIKRQINAGTRFDFMYAEASTMPMLLTEPNHLPLHPFMDFGFFQFIKNHDIRIGLFYSDIFWKFDEYGNSLPVWKKRAALLCYQFDIRMYERLLDRFFLPTKKVLPYFNSKKLNSIAEELPPGTEKTVIPPRKYLNRVFSVEPLTILYVGGLGGHYQFSELIKAVCAVDCCRMILCCREMDWERENESFFPFLSEKIEVVHKSGLELTELFERSDICALVFKRDAYIDMAKPVKAFEYLSNELPVLATEGTDIEEFVKNNQIGWTVNYSTEAISKLLKKIIAEPTLLDELHDRIAVAKEENYWATRAKQVAESLS